MRTVVILALALVLCGVLACDKAGDVVTEQPLGPKAGQGGGVPADQPATPEYPVVVHGEKVVLELTVYHPPTVYLVGAAPVQVLAPADPKWMFDEKLIKLKQAHFPLEVPFQISRECPLGPQKITLGVRVSYAYKADNAQRERNMLIDVVLDVEKKPGRVHRAVRVPVEHFLDVAPNIVQEEIK
jgi:hypothetical protein